VVPPTRGGDGALAARARSPTHHGRGARYRNRL
jgi:hypothetical protein